MHITVPPKQQNREHPYHKRRPSDPKQTFGDDYQRCEGVGDGHSDQEEVVDELEDAATAFVARFVEVESGVTPGEIGGEEVGTSQREDDGGDDSIGLQQFFEREIRKLIRDTEVK